MECIIRTIKDAIHRGLSQWLSTFWSDHVGPALMLLCFTITQATRIAPFAMATGRDALLLSIIVPPLPLPEKPSVQEERPYQEALFGQVLRLQELGGTQLHESKRRIRMLTHCHEDKGEMPTLLFHFQPGQFVLKRCRCFTKVDARAHRPFRVRRVMGAYHQRVTIKPVNGRG